MRSPNVVSPNGGEEWLIGEEHEIIWETTTGDLYSVDYSVDDGRSWLQLVERAMPNQDEGSLGSFTWRIPRFPADMFTSGHLVVSSMEKRGWGETYTFKISFPPNVVVITAYDPDPEEWVDCRIRR